MAIVGAGKIAEHLGMDKQTIYRYVRLKKLPHTKLGRKILFNEDIIDRMFSPELPTKKD